MKNALLSLVLWLGVSNMYAAELPSEETLPTATVGDAPSYELEPTLKTDVVVHYYCWALDINRWPMEMRLNWQNRGLPESDSILRFSERLSVRDGEPTAGVIEYLADQLGIENREGLLLHLGSVLQGHSIKIKPLYYRLGSLFYSPFLSDVASNNCRD